LYHNQPNSPTSAFFTDRVVLVTGGASGIGKAVADKLVALGAKVAIWDIQEERLAECRTHHGDRVLAHSINVADKAAVDSAAAEIAETWGGIDHLLNNAGIIGQRMTALSR
jgi:2-dehydro-3-deoxy-L-rhamnonate dehydrogenase (NAD+)